jgi:hypothetical protein
MSRMLHVPYLPCHGLLNSHTAFQFSHCSYDSATVRLGYVRLGVLLFAVVSVFCSILIHRHEAVTDAASRIIEFTLTGCTTPSLYSHRSQISLPLRLLLRLFTTMSVPLSSRATLFAVCRQIDRTAQGKRERKVRSDVNWQRALSKK